MDITKAYSIVSLLTKVMELSCVCVCVLILTVLFIKMSCKAKVCMLFLFIGLQKNDEDRIYKANQVYSSNTTQIRSLKRCLGGSVG